MTEIEFWREGGDSLVAVQKGLSDAVKGEDGKTYSIAQLIREGWRISSRRRV
jgi:hypothetical protein